MEGLRITAQQLLCTDSPRSIYQNSNMTPRFQGQNCKFFTTPLSSNFQKRLERKENQTKYCWFSVSRHSKQIKIKIKTVRQIKSGIWGMKRGKYTKTLAKLKARRIFRIRDILRNILTIFIEICMETPCWCPPGWAPTWRTETNKNICYRVLLQKREFILRETHKH